MKRLSVSLALLPYPCLVVPLLCNVMTNNYSWGAFRGLLLGGVPWSYNIRCGRGARGCRPSASPASDGRRCFPASSACVQVGAVGGGRLGVL